MPLTAAERARGRELRDACNDLLARLDEAFPVPAHCPPYVVWFRHDCKERGSWALYMHQSYLPLPGTPFAFWWRNSTCAHCGLEVRSGRGVFVLARLDQMEKGAVLHNAADELPAFYAHQDGAAVAR